MRITRVEAILLRPKGAIDTSIGDGSQDGLVVRVHTDEGLVGLGEVDSLPSVAKAIIDAPPSHKIASGLAALLVGENPLEIGRLWQKMYRGSLYFGRRGATIHAISGVEIALWDIAGKAANLPLHRLLGGAARPTLKAYASLLRYGDPAIVARNAARAVERGYRLVKLHEIDVPQVKAARDAIGPDVGLMVDVNCPWPVDKAVEMARKFQPFDLAFLR